jgi:hypothetical protein
VSLTHPDVPGGFGHFRIQSWQLRKDWSIQITAKTVTVSMYDLDMGPKPVDVTAAPLPVLFYPQPQGEWAPYQVQASSLDALFPDEYTFGAAQLYTILNDGSALARITATGKLPANEFIPNCGAPSILSGNVAVSTTGGTIKGGQILRVAVCARNSDGVCSPPSEVLLISIPTGTDTNSFTVGGILWPPGVVGLVDYVLFVSDKDDLICAQGTSGSGPTGTGTPDAIHFEGPIARSTWALPNVRLKNVRLKAKRCVHGGVLGAGIDDVVGSSITSFECIDVASIDDWTGRQLVLIGRQQSNDGTPGEAPFSSFNITAFNPGTGVFTLDRAVTGVQAGDAFCVGFKGYDNSSDPFTFTDTGISNSLNFDPVSGDPTPHSGLTVGYEKGLILRVLAGFNRGARAKVVNNDATSYTLDSPLLVDETSFVIVESSTWEYVSDSSPIDNSNPQVSTAVAVPTANFVKLTTLVGGFTVDDKGIESPDGDAPARMVYVYGVPGNVGKPQATFIFGRSGQGERADVILHGQSNVVIAANGGNLTGWVALAEEAPTGANLKFDITLNGSSIFGGSPVVIPDGSTALAEGFSFAGTVTVNPNDLLQAECTQIGSTDPGRGVVINLYWKMPTFLA